MARKRKIGKREPNGRSQRTRDRDGPTPELEMKRLAAVRGGDPTMSTTPLDIMRERRQVTQDQYNAAEEYARCHRIRCGAGYPINREAGREISEAQEIRAREFIKNATRVLLGVGREAKNAVDNVVCYQRGLRSRGVNNSRPRKAAFFLGIEALGKWYVRAEKRAA
jgi:hypothetical protein